MKKFYTITLLFILLHSATGFSQNSGVLMNENPSGLSNGNLGNQNSWIQNGSSTDVQVADVSSLSYPSYNGGGKYLTVGTTMSSGTYNGINPYKNFQNGTQVNANPNASANTVFYLSFLVRVIQPRRNGANIDWLLSYRNNEGKTLGHFFVKFSSVNTSKINFGVNSKPEIDSTKAIWTTTEYSLNTVYLIVMRYEIVQNTSNDKVYLWVNPSLATEPSTTTANISQTAGDEDYSSSSTITAFQLHQMPYCSNVEFDSFKSAYGENGSNTANNSAAAWTALAPEQTLLPVKFIGFNVAKRNSDVLVQWSTAEESNSSHFEIQRSENGTNWNTAGTITAAGNSSSVKSYSFSDKTPFSTIVYYRIKQVDIGGASHLTPVRVLKNNNQSTEIKVNATPGSSVYVHFSKQVEGKVVVKLVNMNGQTVAQQSLNNPVGQILIPAIANAKGIYVVTITDGRNITVSQKIIL